MTADRELQERVLQALDREAAVAPASGLLIPFIALQMYVHWLIWIAALWAITFPGSTWSVALLFRRAQVEGDDTIGVMRASRGRENYGTARTG